MWGGGTLPIGTTFDDNGKATLDKTAEEIIEAFDSGKTCAIFIHVIEDAAYETRVIDSVFVIEYVVPQNLYVIRTPNGTQYFATSLDDYPKQN